MSSFRRKSRANMSKRETVLADLCSKIVDVVYETFTRRYYLVRISQAKHGNILFIVRRKNIQLLGEERMLLRQNIKHCIECFFRGNGNRADIFPTITLLILS